MNQTVKKKKKTFPPPFCLAGLNIENSNFRESRNIPILTPTHLTSSLEFAHLLRVGRWGMQQNQYRLYSTDQAGQELTHLDKGGKLKMVDVGDKTITSREAIASGVVVLNRKIMQKIKDNSVKKGDVITVARIAGIMAAKKTDQIIPLCHNIALSSVKIDITEDVVVDNCDGTETAPVEALRIVAVARASDRTGVEMEALTAVSVAALTVYDMCKAMSQHIMIKDIRLEQKRGGKSDFER